MNRKIQVALCYDFDGTLSPKNMQEYDFFDQIGDSAGSFWEESRRIAVENNADHVLAYMRNMLCQDVRTTRKAFHDYGRGIDLYPGVETWFDTINDYGRELGLELNHYIVSSGIKEMIEGNPISKHFRKIYACSFMYDRNDVAVWPAVAVNYTTKTQFIFRINKGVEDDNDHVSVNRFVPQEERPIPFSRMIYLGDGMTDIPCMRLVKELGGTSIAVYPPENTDEQKTGAELLLKDNRVNFIAPADYSPGTRLADIIQVTLRKIAADCDYRSLVNGQ